MTWVFSIQEIVRENRDTWKNRAWFYINIVNRFCKKYRLSFKKRL